MKAKKSLGQNFLTSPHIIQDIIAAGKVTSEDTVLEIGPGKGMLTTGLLKTGAHVIAIEKDDRLIPELHQIFLREITSRQLELIHGDILNVAIPHLTSKPYKLVANIPYYITGQIIRMFLESDRQPTSMTLLVQKEVADRIIARDGKESILSLSIKVFGEPQYIRTVGRGAFSPQPSVDSAVISIHDISMSKLQGINKHWFFKMIHAGFAHKRKQLLPNLSSLVDKNLLTDAFEMHGIGLKARAEDLPLDTWLKLCRTISK